MMLFHDRAEAGYEVGVLPGHIASFAGIAGEIVELHDGFRHIGDRFVWIQLGLDGLPIADADALLAAVAGRLAIEKGARRLFFPAQCRREADANALRIRQEHWKISWSDSERP